MIVKGIVFTALLASTPIAIAASQDPRSSTPAGETAVLQRLQQQQQAQADELARARSELAGARAELARIGQQLDHALDALDKTFEPARDRNCSPSRNRALMSHYQWLRDQGHSTRAGGVLAKVVEQVGNDQHQRNSVAWDLMTDKETVGKCDDVALAIVQKMEQSGVRDPNHFDTMALAYFLTGGFDKAVELEQKAIAGGGNGDEFRRRLRTYEAARDRLAKSQSLGAASGETMVAANDDQ